MQVYLPDELYDEVKRRNIPASELLQLAVRAEVERRAALDSAAGYVQELRGEVGEPSARQRAQAAAVARRIRDRRLHQAG